MAKGVNEGQATVQEGRANFNDVVVRLHWRTVLRRVDACRRFQIKHDDLVVQFHRLSLF